MGDRLVNKLSCETVSLARKYGSALTLHLFLGTKSHIDRTGANISDFVGMPTFGADCCMTLIHFTPGNGHIVQGRRLRAGIHSHAKHQTHNEYESKHAQILCRILI
jgi:hypothetical protein